MSVQTPLPPIDYLVPYITTAPFNIAPQNASATDALRNTHKLSMELTEGRGYNIGINIQDGKIYMGERALNYLWAHAQWFYVDYQEKIKAQQEALQNGDILNAQFNIVGNARQQQARELLDWARDNLESASPTPWPAHLLKPEDASIAEDVAVTNELFLAALGWTLQHEMGHAHHQHPIAQTSMAKAEEREADRYASDTILAGVQAQPVLDKLGLGIATAILTLESLETSKDKDYSHYPAAIERLGDSILRPEFTGNELVHAYTFGALQSMYPDETSFPLDGNSFEEMLSDACFTVYKMQL